MAISIRCQHPACQKPLWVKDARAGKRVKCPACGQIMLVPPAGKVTQPVSQIVAQADPQPSRTGDSPAIATPMSPRLWFLEGASPDEHCAVLLTKDILALSPQVLRKAKIEEIRADYERGNHSPMLLGKTATIIPLDAIASIERHTTMFFNHGWIEIWHGKDGKSFIGIVGRPIKRGEEVFAALRQALGPDWRCLTSRKVEIVWQMMGWVLFLTAMLALLIAYGCHLAGLEQSVPWSLALAGFVMLPPVIFLTARHDMPRLSMLCLLCLIGLIAGVVGQVGVIGIGVAVAGLLWLPLLSRGLLLNVTTTASVKPVHTGSRQRDIQDSLV